MSMWEFTRGLLQFQTGAWLISVLLPAFAVVAGVWVYRDAKGRKYELAPLFGFAVAGLFLAGSVPGLVALLIAEDTAVQGFPTSVRVIPGVVALVLYLRLR